MWLFYLPQASVHEGVKTIKSHYSLSKLEFLGHYGSIFSQKIIVISWTTFLFLFFCTNLFVFFMWWSWTNSEFEAFWHLWCYCRKIFCVLHSKWELEWVSFERTVKNIEGKMFFVNCHLHAKFSTVHTAIQQFFLRLPFWHQNGVHYWECLYILYFSCRLE